MEETRGTRINAERTRQALETGADDGRDRLPVLHDDAQGRPGRCGPWPGHDDAVRVGGHRRAARRQPRARRRTRAGRNGRSAAGHPVGDRPAAGRRLLSPGRRRLAADAVARRSRGCPCRTSGSASRPRSRRRTGSRGSGCSRHALAAKRSTSVESDADRGRADKEENAGDRLIHDDPSTAGAAAPRCRRSPRAESLRRSVHACGTKVRDGPSAWLLRCAGDRADAAPASPAAADLPPDRRPAACSATRSASSPTSGSRPRAAEIDRTAEFPWDVKELLASHDILGLPFPEAVRRPRRRAPDRLPGDRADQPGLRDERPDPRRPGARRRCRSSSPARDEQKERWFPDLAAGRKLIAFALTEAEAGCDAAADPDPGRARRRRLGHRRREAVHQPGQRRRPDHRLRGHAIRTRRATSA